MIGVDLNAAGNEGSARRFVVTTALSGESHIQATRSSRTFSRVISSSGAYLELPASPPYVGHCPRGAPRCPATTADHMTAANTPIRERRWRIQLPRRPDTRPAQAS